MTILSGRRTTALLVVDVQNGVVGEAHRRDAVVANIGALVVSARSSRVPIVWVRHCDEDLVQGSAEWSIVDGLVPLPGEATVDKCFGDSFEDTDLESRLAERGVGALVVAGAQTDACIRATIHGAVVRGYDVTLVGDAHTTEDLTEWGAPPPETVIAFTNLSWANHSAPGRRIDVVDTAHVTFEPPLTPPAAQNGSV